MTTIMRDECKCAICGATNEYSAIGSTNAFGSSDLDLRPPEMERSTMSLWVQECPFCGYVSSMVSDPSSVTREWLQSERYVKCDGIAFESNLAARFYKYYLIKLADDSMEDAFFAVLHAAWACDDAGDTKNAVKCRELAIPLITEAIDQGHGNKETLLLIRADLLRRAGKFDELLGGYADVSFSEDLMNQILKFQLQKAAAKDTDCYTVQDAIDAGNE